MTNKEQAILKTLAGSLKFNDFKPKLTISQLKDAVLGMESFSIVISDDHKSNKTRPIKYTILLSYYNEQVPEATHLYINNIEF